MPLRDITAVTHPFHWSIVFIKRKKKKPQPREEVQLTAWIVEKMGDDILITLIRILFIQFASVTAAGEVTNVN